jgi:hypothetical protein
MAKEKEDKFMNSLNETVKEKIEIEDMPLNTLRDYRLYNEAVLKENKRLKLRRHEVKPCPIELHPHQRVIFRSNDQPHNPQKVFLSNSLIHFDKTLTPGQTYDLPECIVHHLSTRENPEWAWFDNADGSRETRIKSKKPRFSLNSVYQEA